MSTGDGFGDVSFAPERRTTRILGARVRLPTDLDIAEKLFLILGLLSIIVAAVFTFVKIKDFSTSSADFAYSIMLLVNLGFIAYYVLSGIFMERPFEVVVSLFAVLVVMLYCIVQYAVNERRTVLKLARLIVICILGPIDIGLGIWAVRRYFEGPTGIMMKIAGGNVQLQGICRYYFIFCAFIIFDFQVVITLLILMATDGSLDTADKVIMGVGVPFSFIWLILGRLAARYEKYILSAVFLGLCWVEPAYIIYSFIKAAENMDVEKLLPRGDELVIREKAIIAAGVIGLLVRIVLVSMKIKVTINFKKGLKERLDEEI